MHDALSAKFGVFQHDLSFSPGSHELHMLYVSPVLLVAVHGIGCASITRWVGVRDSLYCAPCLAESPQLETMLYRSAPTLGEVHDTLPVRSRTVMTYVHIGENDRIVCPHERTWTILELSFRWILYRGE